MSTPFAEKNFVALKATISSVINSYYWQTMSSPTGDRILVALNTKSNRNVNSSIERILEY